MKKYILEFLKRGLISSVGGPIVLAIIYAIQGATGSVTAIPVWDVCQSILTISLLAFLVAGFTTLYQIERLPLFAAILIHGIALYLTYILIYLLNGWIVNQMTPILIFTGCFIAGYAIIWLIIYLITKKSTDNLNRQLKN